MPTAGRLAGAIVFALFGWYIAGIAAPFFPEGRPPAALIPVSAFIGLLIGWMFVGTRAGNGYNAAIGIGLTAALLWSFWVLFLISFRQMIRNAMRRLYDGPMEALVDTFNLMMEQAIDFIDVQLIASVVIGGVVCAWITEYFGRRFP